MNKKGWWLRVELVIILLFVICLVIVSIGLNRLGLLGENPNAPIQDVDRETFDYTVLEKNMVEATKKYFSEYYEYEMNDTEMIVRLSTLKYNGYISDLLDENGKSCSGYTKIISSNSGIVYVGYIKCPKYTSQGYESKNDW